MSNKCLFLRGANREILPGKMPEEQFWLLVDISPIHSEKVINALMDFMVRGYTRKMACEKHGVSQGYFSGAFDRFWRAHQTVKRLMPFYISSEAAEP
ncbi:adhesin biosynthesis transcription regulatory family protein [Escherichia coli O8:H49]